MFKIYDDARIKHTFPFPVLIFQCIIWLKCIRKQKLRESLFTIILTKSNLKISRNIRQAETKDFLFLTQDEGNFKIRGSGRCALFGHVLIFFLNYLILTETGA